MKNRLLTYICGLVCLLCLVTILNSSAQAPVSWSVNSERTNAGAYTLQVNGAIATGWHLYAEADCTEGLEGVILKVDHEGVTPGELQSLSMPERLYDHLFDNKQLPVYKHEIRLQQDLQFSGQVPSEVRLSVRAFASNGVEFLPLEESISVSLAGGITVTAEPEKSLFLKRANLENVAASCGIESDNDGSMLTIFLLGFIGGLLALLTPCVFPMVPLTVTFFSSRSKARKQVLQNGFLFGLFILLIYLACSLPFHLLDSVEPGIFNSLSTNVWVNLFFFVVFVIFALSFFGLFELTLPGNLTNKIDSKSSLGSMGGIFFMALTLALVSFSCTGPILGTLLVGSLSSDSGAWQLTSGMAGFGLALALPFAAFAMFPSWLQLIPRSGGWLDTVKKSLAFVELALALKFLSNADLVAQWGLLKREVFIGIWILLTFALALYLFGIIRFPKESRLQPISRGRGIAGALVLIFAMYIAPGLANTSHARLQLLSGFPPPLSYSIYDKSKTSGPGNGGQHVEPLVLNDFETAVRLAKAMDKPMLVDFTGWACVNCRKMEELVWSDPRISQLIKDDFVLVSLYVDDRQQLPVSERFTFTGQDGYTKEIRTIGDKWATFQAINFGQVTQPLYVILNPDGELLNQPVGYTSNKKSFEYWLRCGLNEFLGTTRIAPLRISDTQGASLFNEFE